MAMVVGPITIPTVISDLNSLITQIRRKNAILIDYYIYPKPVPTELSAHDPRHAILVTRLASLAKLSYPQNGQTGNLSYIFDEPTALAASYLLEIVDQLLNAIHGFEEIFELRYNPELKTVKPYGTIYKTLEDRETQLKQIMIDGQRPPPHGQQPLRPEDLRPSNPVYFCRGAVQLINGRDKGRVSYVAPNDLLPANRAMLNKFRGAFLWWECPACDFRVRFHITSSTSSTIHNNDEVREHPGINIEYRSAFLAKSHLFSDVGGDRDTELMTRIPSRSTAWFGRNRSSSSSSIVIRDQPKYGCLFCFAEGRTLAWEKDNVFTTGRELADHIYESHRKNKKLPPSLVLQKLWVAVDGKVGEGVRRWDVNLK